MILIDADNDDKLSHEQEIDLYTRLVIAMSVFAREQYPKLSVRQARDVAKGFAVFLEQCTHLHEMIHSDARRN